jgi:hypothetical protein
MIVSSTKWPICADYSYRTSTGLRLRFAFADRALLLQAPASHTKT